MSGPQEEGGGDTGGGFDEGTPLCTGCGRPVTPGRYYCERCGAAVNNLTPYIPYVDIPFNYAPYGEMWRTLIGKRKAGVGVRIFIALMILLTAPIMLLGLLFVLVEGLRNRKGRSQSPTSRGDSYGATEDENPTLDSHNSGGLP